MADIKTRKMTPREARIMGLDIEVVDVEVTEMRYVVVDGSYESDPLDSLDAARADARACMADESYSGHVEIVDADTGDVVEVVDDDGYGARAPQTSHRTHDCGGTILTGRDEGNGAVYRYCDTCGAYTYGYAMPSGTDRVANRDAWDHGEDRSPDTSPDTP